MNMHKNKIILIRQRGVPVQMTVAHQEIIVVLIRILSTDPENCYFFD